MPPLELRRWHPALARHGVDRLTAQHPEHEFAPPRGLGVAEHRHGGRRRYQVVRDEVQELARAQLAWVFQDLPRRPFLDDPPVGHEDDPVRHLAREAHLVGDDQHRHARFGQLPDHREHLGHQLGIEGRGRLVEEHHARRDGQRAHDRHSLLLAPREPERQVVRVVSQADAREKLHASTAGDLDRLAVDPYGRLADVLERREMLEEVELLEDHPDAGLGPLGRDVPQRTQDPIDPCVADVAPVDRNLTTVQCLQVRDEPQQGALPRPARPHDRDHLTAIHREIDAAEHLTVAIGLPDVTTHDEWRAVGADAPRGSADEPHEVDRGRATDAATGDAPLGP